MRLKEIVLILMLSLLFFSLSQAKEMTPLDSSLVMIIKNVSGDKESQMKEQASLEAVKECLGRIYFTKNIFLARDILEKYIDLNYSKFVYSIEVTNKKFSSGKTHLELKIFVNFNKLLNDLNEKRFLYEPKLHPIFYVFLEEKTDGQKATHSTGNTAILNTIKDLKQKTISNPIGDISPNIDVLQDKNTLLKAIEAAQKNEIEVIITGKSETNKVEEKELYFDKYTSYETKINLNLIRVDTGEILTQANASGLAINNDPERAIELSIIRAAMQATNEIMDYFKDNWDKTVLDKADYKIMFTGLKKPDLDVLDQTMLSLGHNAKLFLRSYYYDVAVINLVFKGDKKDLLRFFETFPNPTLKIVSVKDSNIEIAVRQ